MIDLVSLFFAGILAGEELVIRCGVRGPLAALEQQAHIQLRQALIRRLRVLVPAILAPAAVTGIAAAILDVAKPGFAWRCAGLLALLLFISVTLFGTVPINQAALEWRPDAPPQNWKELVARWERLDTVRCWAAVLAFAFFSKALALRLSRL